MKQLLAASIACLLIVGCIETGPSPAPPTPPAPSNTVWQITGTHDWQPVTVKASRNHGGAIYSIEWAGTEFVNSDDNGREDQTAWTMNDQGEQLNPTEAGASADGTPANHSSTVVLAARIDDNILRTFAQLAWWFPVNGEVTSPHKLGKTVTLGYNGLTNVLHHQITVTLANDAQRINMEGLTIYVPPNFTRFFIFDLSNGAMTEVPPPGTMVYNQPNPTIVATADLSRAVALYGLMDFYFYGSGMLPKLNASSWQRGPIPAGDISWDSFTVFGTFNDVASSLRKLKEK